MHQADLLELPKNIRDHTIYRYSLNVVDLVMHKVDGELLKKPEDVLEAFKTIYNHRRLQPPTHELQVDSDSEFKSVVYKCFTKFMVNKTASTSSRLVGKPLHMRRNRH